MDIKQRARAWERCQVLGWTAVVISTAVICFWAFWGVIENFHEGWYYDALLPNLGLMLAQYLGPMLAFLGVTLVSIRWRRVGAALHLALALFAIWFFDAFSNAATFLIILPLLGLGALYLFGCPRPRRRALALAAGLPLLTALVFGIEPAWRVSQRVDDGERGARLVEGDGVALTWAPAGPGWPAEGGDWAGALEACRRLDEDGLGLAEAPRDLWRLPTAEEAVRSMARHGENSGGTWDGEAAEARYETTPDKETPLWDPHSQVIYWWTATEVDAERAYIIAYDGQVWPRSKDFGPAYLGYRCVRDEPDGG